MKYTISCWSNFPYYCIDFTPHAENADGILKATTSQGLECNRSCKGNFRSDINPNIVSYALRYTSKFDEYLIFDGVARDISVDHVREIWVRLIKDGFRPY
jgi:hypothetical protein